MKCALSGSVLAIASVIGGQAIAADFPTRTVYRMPPQPYSSPWTGFYLGGHIGGAFATSDWVSTTPGFVGLNDASAGLSGFIGGGQVGFNYQFDRIVTGIEADGSWANLNKTVASCFQDPTQSCTTKADWFATLTGRLGFTSDRTLFYAKGGAAWGAFKYANPCPTTCTSPNYSANETRSGWTAGGGIEYALTGNWSVKLEYDYLDFGTAAPTFVGTAHDTFTEDVNNRVHMVKAGFNFRFGLPR